MTIPYRYHGCTPARLHGVPQGLDITTAHLRGVQFARSRVHLWPRAGQQTFFHTHPVAAGCPMTLSISISFPGLKIKPFPSPARKNVICVPTRRQSTSPQACLVSASAVGLQVQRSRSCLVQSLVETARHARYGTSRSCGSGPVRVCSCNAPTLAAHLASLLPADVQLLAGCCLYPASTVGRRAQAQGSGAGTSESSHAANQEAVIKTSLTSSTTTGSQVDPGQQCLRST